MYNFMSYRAKMTVNGYLSINAVSDQEENLKQSTLLRNVLSCVLGKMEYCKSVYVMYVGLILFVHMCKVLKRQKSPELCDYHV